MAAFTKVITAPLAIIKIGGNAVGKMKNLTITENFDRGRVTGIGELTPSEVPALIWNGTINCGLYLIDFARALNKLTKAEVLQRRVNTLDSFVDTVLLQDQGVQIDIMRKVTLSTDQNTGIITSGLEIFASVQGGFLTRESMDISEGQIGGRNADFVYITPILYPN